MEKFGWKERRHEDEGEYRARSLSHEANTSIEYGEKTWTTAQTVRDIMQNHLDAESEKTHKEIASRFFDAETLEVLASSEEHSAKLKELLYALYLYQKHHCDMSAESRQTSCEYLKTLTEPLPIEVEFSPDSLEELLEGVEENLPRITFEVTDTETGEKLSAVSYEALRDEPKFQERVLGGYRFQIAGVKMADHGSGYDSQLASVFVSSKGDKKHTRGKFGEGAKMSELHVLRGQAKLKMESTYNLATSDGEKHRIWRSRPRASEENRLVASGAEVEKSGSIETGSAVTIDLNEAKESFKNEFVENIDPRVGGLGKNIVYYSSDELFYPNPLSEKYVGGVNMKGEGKVQYVQGIRVELAEESFGHTTPWLSYDLFDPAIIGGRDRNEIKAELDDYIKKFWHECDRPDMLRTLMRMSLFEKGEFTLGAEQKFLSRVFGERYSHYGSDEEVDAVLLQKQQETLDQAFIELLKLNPSDKTVILREGALDERHAHDYDHQESIRKLKSFIETEGYRVIYVKNTFDLEDFRSRNEAFQNVFEAGDIHDEIRARQRTLREHREREPFVEGEKEKEIRRIFESAVENVKNFLAALSVERKVSETLEFVDPNDQYQRDTMRPSYGGKFIIEQRRIRNIESEEENKKLQREMELCLLGGEGWGGEHMKSAQHFLDRQMERLLEPASPIIARMPEELDHVKDGGVAERVIEGLLGELREDNHINNQVTYRKFMQLCSGEMTVKEAQFLLAEDNGIDLGYDVRSKLSRHRYIEGNTITRIDHKGEMLGGSTLSERLVVGNWNELPVYQLSEGEFFIPASLKGGGVLARGEGKEREYYFNDGLGVLHIGKYGIKYNVAEERDGATVQLEGIFIKNNDGFRRRHSEDPLAVLEEYQYFPSGTAEQKDVVVESGKEVTAIPIEYGKDEWDNPVRVFQDIVQNHIDASPEGEKVSLQYEVERDGERVWLSEGAVRKTDLITGIAMEDSGEGYGPHNIATMGASSKKSPLFAGKYGEGQKMVAAASLRNSFELSYYSTVSDDSGNSQSWAAQTSTHERNIVLDGKEITKQFVAFTVDELDGLDKAGSKTVLRLPVNPTKEQLAQWSEWLAVVSPHEVDDGGHRGLSRYARQLRGDNNENVYTVGKVSILFDEPGAVYENGLRINATAEDGRNLAYGYDVPEIVTTRERNSYDPSKLKYYVEHLFRHTTDKEVIKEVVRKMQESGGSKKTAEDNPFDHRSMRSDSSQATSPSDLESLSLSSSGGSAVGFWSEVVRSEWAGKLLYSSEKLARDSKEDMFGDDDSYHARERREKAKTIMANMVHFGREQLLNVSPGTYDSFSSFTTTLENAVEKLEKRTVQISPETRDSLALMATQAAQIFAETYSERGRFPGDRETEFLHKLTEWLDFDRVVADPDAVGLAPVDSGFHGLASDGMILNERLFIEGNKQKIAAVVIHELNHLLTDARDYTEEFVGVMYDVAQYLLKIKETPMLFEDINKPSRFTDILDDMSDLGVDDDSFNDWSQFLDVEDV